MIRPAATRTTFLLGLVAGVKVLFGAVVEDVLIKVSISRKGAQEEC